MATTASSFASSGSTHGAMGTAQAAAYGAQADVRGTLAAVHFRDEQDFAIFSLERPDGSRVRALGYLPLTITLRADVRIAGTWTQHAQYGWQVQVRTAELMDRVDRRSTVAFLVAYTPHLVISSTT